MRSISNKCLVKECQRDGATRGYCRSHHHRLLRYGDPLGTPPPRKHKVNICQVIDCGKRTKYLQYCGEHYQKDKRNGSPLTSQRESHGLTETDEYKIWCGIKRRCFNKNEPGFKHYGERGITMCQEWKDSFLSFYNYMGKRPSKDYSIERKENEKNYEPGNCIWATKEMQMNNMRSNHFHTIDGTRKTMTQWSRFYGIDSRTVFGRLSQGWSENKALGIED